MLKNLRQPRRVVITGLGCVTPLGVGRAAFWGGLVRGESGVRRIEGFDVTTSPVRIAGQIQDFDWERELKPKDRRHVARTVPLALAAARAIRTGRIPPTINLDEPAPECDLDYTPNRARERDVRVALCNCIGFGSKNSALVVERLSE